MSDERKWWALVPFALIAMGSLCAGVFVIIESGDDWALSLPFVGMFACIAVIAIIRGLMWTQGDAR